MGAAIEILKINRPVVHVFQKQNFGGEREISVLDPGSKV